MGQDATVLYSVCESAEIGPGASVGPYARLRPGTRIGPGAHIGTHVELKNSTVGEGAKVPHLTYVGDADIGEHSNIGAATIFANYDGMAKHHTTIGSHVFTGSDTVLVAPVTIGDGAYTAAGSVDHRGRAAGSARRRPRPAAQLGRMGGSGSGPGTRSAAAARPRAGPQPEPQDRSTCADQDEGAQDR